MKSNTLRTVLEWALLTSLIFSCYFFVTYCFRSRSLRGIREPLQAEMIKNQQAQAFMARLLTDVVEYSKRDPSVLPILELVGYNPGKPAAPVAPKAAGNK